MTFSIFFDLDGTLIDTAPDLAASANRTFTSLGYETLPEERLRHHVSSGARALLAQRIPFSELEQARSIMLEDYLLRLDERSSFFESLSQLLQRLDKQGICWGILTNKPRYLSEPLLTKLATWWDQSSLFCAPDFSEIKPSPVALNAITHQYAIDPNSAYYVGDHRKDIQTAQSAGWNSIAVDYGYHEPNDPPSQWEATLRFQTSSNLSEWIYKQI